MGQVNTAGGINGTPIERMVYDDQESPGKDVLLAVKKTTQDMAAVGFSGSYSGSTRAAVTVFQENAIPYVSAYVVHPDITRG